MWYGSNSRTTSLKLWGAVLMMLNCKKHWGRYHGISITSKRSPTLIVCAKQWCGGKNCSVIYLPLQVLKNKFYEPINLLAQAKGLTGWSECKASQLWFPYHIGDEISHFFWKYFAKNGTKNLLCYQYGIMFLYVRLPWYSLGF